MLALRGQIGAHTHRKLSESEWDRLLALYMDREGQTIQQMLDGYAKVTGKCVSRARFYAKLGERIKALEPGNSAVDTDEESGAA